MPLQPFRNLLGHLRRRVAAPAELTDGLLLERFAARRDEAAFEALLARHGALVWGVCRRVLRDGPDAEDAFQATFLVLAQKAGAIRKQTALASWLYGVAYRLALKARARAAQRDRHERQAAARPRTAAAEADAELRTLLEEEMGRLPDKYRAALVLCYYQGKTHEQAAQALGWPAGSISKRLARGRELLRQRLTRRGVTAPAALLGAALAGAGEVSAAPAALLRLTAVTVFEAARGQPSAAAALARGAVGEMSPARVKALAAAALLLGVLAAGLAVAHTAWVGRAPAADAPPGGWKAPEPGLRPALTDCLGDPLPPGAIGRLGTTRLHHGSVLHAVAFSPDGKALATAGLDKGNVVRLWDAATGKELRRFAGHAAHAVSVAFAPDGKTLAAGAVNGKTLLWDVASGRTLQEFSEGGWQLAYSPNSRLLAAAQLNAIVLWDPTVGHAVRRLEGHRGVVSGVAFSPDGKQLAAAGGDDKRVWLWDVATGKPRPPLAGHTKRVNSVAFSPDGKLLASGSDDQTIRFWNLDTGREVRQLRDSDNRINSVAFSPDGRRLLAGRFQTLQLWDLAACQEVRSFRVPEGVELKGAFSPDGKTVTAAVGERAYRLRLWDAGTGRERRVHLGHDAPLTFVALTPDGRRAVTAAVDDSVRLWDVGAARVLREWHVASRHGSECPVALAPDGRTLAVGKFEKIVLVDVASGKERAHGHGHQNRIYTLAFSPDGTRLASTASDRTTRLWDAATGKELRRFRGHADDPRCVAFSPDGRRLVTGGEQKDPTLCLWDAATGKLLRRFTGHRAYVTGVAFASDGRTLASSAADDTVRLWDVQTGEERHRIEFKCDGGPCQPTLAFAPDGRTLLVGTANGNVELWEVTTGRLRHRWAGHPEGVHAVAFARDGRTVASASADTTVLLWDVSGQAGAARPHRLSAQQLAALWDDLAGADAARAHRAIWSLSAAPAQAVEALRARLRPAAPVAAARLRGLVADLDSKQFAVRRKAMAELEALADLAEPALRQALAGSLPLEARQRVGQLLQKLARPTAPSELLRAPRAAEVLEQIGTPAARRLLEALAGGAPAWLTEEARASLRRLACRGNAAP